MGGRTKMEVSNLQKLNDDGYLYVPEIIIDPSNLYFPPPKTSPPSEAFIFKVKLLLRSKSLDRRVVDDL